MFFLIFLCFFIIANSEAQLPKTGRCPESKIKLPDYNPNGIMGQWYGYAAYPNCDPPGRCRRTEFIDNHEGGMITVVKSLSTAPNTFQVFETVETMKYVEATYYVVTQSWNPGRVGLDMSVWATDYTSYLVKGSCVNFETDASLHWVWILTRSPNPSPSVVAKINDVIKIEGIIPEYLGKFNQTNCPAEY